ncbi:MAG: MarR family transcriptional regulator [Candidatus Melainabacteria bacterium]|nr:MAG: MarR family transcriptional regulator [Candidatus Melainabacteria bacterium]
MSKTQISDERKREIIKTYSHFFTRQSQGYLNKRATTLLTTDLNEILLPLGLTRNHWVILSCLWRQDGLPVTYIAKQVQQVGGTLTGVLDRMEKRKFIKRKRDKNDRRIWRAWLTDEGVHLLDILPEKVESIWQKAFNGVNKPDQERFSTLVNRAINNLSPDHKCELPLSSPLIPAQYAHILPPYSLGYRMKLLSLLITRDCTEKFDPYNVTTTHWIVLCRLWQNDGLLTSEVGEFLEQIGGSLTGVLERMEERGFITRKQDQTDKRCSRNYLTKKGLELIEVLPQLAQSCLDDTFRSISSDDNKFFRSFLNEVISNFD